MQPSPTSKIQVLDVESLDPSKIHFIFVDSTIVSLQGLAEIKTSVHVEAIFIPIYDPGREFIKCVSGDSIKAMRRWLDELEKDKENQNAASASAKD